LSAKGFLGLRRVRRSGTPGRSKSCRSPDTR